MNELIKKYLSKIGRIGGKKSRRTLTRKQAQKMVEKREKMRHDLELSAQTEERARAEMNRG